MIHHDTRPVCVHVENLNSVLRNLRLRLTLHIEHEQYAELEPLTHTREHALRRMEREDWRDGHGRGCGRMLGWGGKVSVIPCC